MRDCREGKEWRSRLAQFILINVWMVKSKEQSNASTDASKRLGTFLRGSFSRAGGA